MSFKHISIYNAKKILKSEKGGKNIGFVLKIGLNVTDINLFYNYKLKKVEKTRPFLALY